MIFPSGFSSHQNRFSQTMICSVYSFFFLPGTVILLAFGDRRAERPFKVLSKKNSPIFSCLSHVRRTIQRHSRSDWMGPWAVWSGVGHPTHGSGWIWMSLRSPPTKAILSDSMDIYVHAKLFKARQKKSYVRTISHVWQGTMCELRISSQLIKLVAATCKSAQTVRVGWLHKWV